MLEAFKASHDQVQRSRRMLPESGAAHPAERLGVEDSVSKGVSRPELGASLAAPERAVAGDSASIRPVSPARAPREASSERSMRRAAAPPRGARALDDPDGGTQTVLPLAWAPLLGLLLLVLGLTFGVGYLTGSQAHAAEASAPGEGPVGGDGQGVALSAPGSPGLAAPESAQLSEVSPRRRPADAAFGDPNNVYSLKVIQYNNTEYGRARALDTFAFLDRQGLPVVEPVERGSVIHLMMGAAPSTDALRDLQDDVRKLEGPTGGQPFFDAYLVRIDSVRRR